MSSIYYLVAVVQSRSCVHLFVTPWTTGHQVPLSFITPRAFSNSCPLSWWCYLTISSSSTPFFHCLQSFPASGSFLMSQLFALDDRSIGASASVSILPTNIQGWFPLGLIGLISLLPKGLSRVFSSWNPSMRFICSNVS